MLLENIQIFEEDDEEDLLNYSDSITAEHGRFSLAGMPATGQTHECRKGATCCWLYSYGLTHLGGQGPMPRCR